MATHSMVYNLEEAMVEGVDAHHQWLLNLFAFNRWHFRNSLDASTP